MTPKEAIAKCRNASLHLGLTRPHFLVIHSYIKTLYQESTTIDTMAIGSSGTIYFNTQFVEQTPRDQLAGVMAHEMLHLVLQHHNRGEGKETFVFNIACDMAINHALRTDGVALPDDAVYPPGEYTGDIYAEAIYEWLMKNAVKINLPNVGKGGSATAGCSVIQDGPNKNGKDWAEVAVEAEAQARQSPTGSAGVSGLLKPRDPKINWRQIIRHSMHTSQAKIGRAFTVLSKRNRRSPARGPQLPGWIATEANVAFVADVSGSMNREWVEQILAEIKSAMKMFPSIKCLLVVHTAVVEFSAFVTPKDENKMMEGLSRTGGTDPLPAYEEVKKMLPKADVLCHFTDCEFGMTEWPEVPAKHLIIGSFVREPSTRPPVGSQVILCTPD